MSPIASATGPWGALLSSGQTLALAVDAMGGWVGGVGVVLAGAPGRGEQVTVSPWDEHTTGPVMDVFMVAMEPSTVDGMAAIPTDPSMATW